MGKFQIGLLNFSGMHQPQEYLETMQDLIDYARHADQLGFSRFWLGEHYIHKKVQTWTSPDMLLPLIAAATEHLRIGIAGTLIGIHQPMDIAANYKTLSNLFPGRIDLGLAKGGLTRPGIGAVTDAFETNARKLASYLYDEDFHEEYGLVLPPFRGALPDLWLLGSSYNGLELALELGANFARSTFHQRKDPLPDLPRREAFVARFSEKFHRQPRLTLAIAGCCHEDPATAERIVHQGLRDGLLQLDAGSIIAGPPKLFYDRLVALRATFRIDEFVLLPFFEDRQHGLRSLELLAREFDLTAERAVGLSV